MKIYEINHCDLNLRLFAYFDRYQVVKKCIRKKQSNLSTIDNHFIDDWCIYDFISIIEELKRCTYIIGLFENNHLIGFASMLYPLNKNDHRAVLYHLYISSPYRRQGLGTLLLNNIKEKARTLNANLLFISSHQAIETQRFYLKNGGYYLDKIQPDYHHQEPYDLQIEIALKDTIN